jgi:hypothetical protein
MAGLSSRVSESLDEEARMSDPQERPDEQPRDDSLVLLAEKLLREPEVVAWLGAANDDDDTPRAA